MKKATSNAAKWHCILRSCLCFALVLTLSLGHIVPISVAKAADSADTESSVDTGGETTGWASDEDLFALTFSEKDEDILKGINRTEYGNYYSVVDDPADSSNSCLKMSTTEDKFTRFGWGNTIDTSIHKQVVYEYKLSIDPNEQMHPHVRIWVDNSGFNTLLYLVGGEIKSSTSATATSYGTVTAGKWTKISIVADHNANIYDLYVDDELMSFRPNDSIKRCDMAANCFKNNELERTN